MSKSKRRVIKSNVKPRTPDIPEANPADVASIDAIIAAAYDSISGPAGQKRDWERERSLYYPDARLIPTAKPSANDELAPELLDVHGLNARAASYFAEHGFYEKEISRRTKQFVRITHL